MRKILPLVALVSVFGSGIPAAGSVQASLQTCVIKVEGMACGACAARVEREAKKIDGVTAAKVSQPKSRAEVTYDPAKTSPEAIARIITEKTGFAAEADEGH
ncbi:MAG: cation transporter [Acidobacteria bacterium]|nr:cation transporter [Acidobacteriota bacterium]